MTNSVIEPPVVPPVEVIVNQSDGRKKENFGIKSKLGTAIGVEGSIRPARRTDFDFEVRSLLPMQDLFDLLSKEKFNPRIESYSKGQYTIVLSPGRREYKLNVYN